MPQVLSLIALGAAQFVVRKVNPRIVATLRLQAAANGRSVGAEQIVTQHGDRTLPIDALRSLEGRGAFGFLRCSLH